MKDKPDMQDVRIRNVPVKLVRRLRSVLVAQGRSLIEWFIAEAAKTADRGGER